MIIARHTYIAMLPEPASRWTRPTLGNRRTGSVRGSGTGEERTRVVLNWTLCSIAAALH